VDGVLDVEESELDDIEDVVERSEGVYEWECG
jgi:hypothetical protein